MFTFKSLWWFPFTCEFVVYTFMERVIVYRKWDYLKITPNAQITLVFMQKKILCYHYFEGTETCCLSPANVSYNTGKYWNAFFLLFYQRALHWSLLLIGSYHRMMSTYPLHREKLPLMSLEALGLDTLSAKGASSVTLQAWGSFSWTE